MSRLRLHSAFQSSILRICLRAMALITIVLAMVQVAIATDLLQISSKPTRARKNIAVPSESLSSSAPIHPLVVRAPRVRREPAPLTPELRRKGYNECNPADPIGWGPYKPFVRCGMGWMAVPQRGGHSADFGYDVLVHFHGAPALRKFLVQVARGVVFVGVDLGIGSGKYSDAFTAADSFGAFRAAIEATLVRQTGQNRARIRHLALSAWSAGYGAVNEILKHGDEGIDAVILLDALHAGWDPAKRRDGTSESVSAAYIAPTIQFARKAAQGEKIFVFTHSYIDPVTYPSTSLTAKLLLKELGLERRQVEIPDGMLTQDGAVDQLGLHVWSYRGHDEMAHCAHLSLITRVLGDVVEESWDTPELDRSVQPIATEPR